jgi:tetratricopeptide (TPR) repeat protein
MIGVAKQKKRRRNERQNTVTMAVILAVVTLVLYAQVVTFDFINLDDPDYVYNNQSVRTGITAENVTWAFTLHGPGQWHPLTWISHQLDCQLFELDAGMHHLVNALLHIANTVLLFFLLVKMTSALAPSFLVAALFAWHPLSVESVAWVSERRDVLSMLFWLLALHAYVAYARAGGWRNYGWVVFLFACGLMSKPMVVTLPCVMLLLDGWPLHRWDRLAPLEQNVASRRFKLGYLVGEKIPLLAMSLLASFFTFLIQMQEQAVGTFSAYPLTSRLANAVLSYATYLRKLVWPHDLAFFYPYPDTVNMFWVGVSALVLLGLTALCLWQIRRRPYLLVGWLWYLGTLVPVIGLLQVGGQALADRYTYIPLIGIYIAVAWALAEFLGWLHSGQVKRQVTCQWGIATIVLVPCLLVSFQQISYWKSGVLLYSRALEVTEDNSVAENNLAADYLLLGKLDESMRHFKEANRISPDRIQPYMGMASIAEERHDPVRALELLRQAEQLNQHEMGKPIIAQRLAWLLATAPNDSVRDGAEALKLAELCVRLTQLRDANCLHTLAVALAEDQQFPKAIQVARQASTIARQNNQQKLADQINLSLDGYRQEQPFRDPRWLPK